MMFMAIAADGWSPGIAIDHEITGGNQRSTLQGTWPQLRRGGGTGHSDSENQQKKTPTHSGAHRTIHSIPPEASFKGDPPRSRFQVAAPRRLPHVSNLESYDSKHCLW